MRRLIYIVCMIIGCGALYGQEAVRLQVREVELKETGGRLAVSIGLDIPARIIKSHQQLMIYPVVQSAASEKELPPIELIGQNKRKALGRMVSLRGEKENLSSLYQMEIRKNRRESLLYSVEVPYESWMDETTTLSFRQQLAGCVRTTSVESAGYPVRVETEGRELLQLQPFVAFVVPAVTAKEREETGSAYLDFPSGGAAILPDYRRNPQELGRISQTIDKARQDPDIQITGIYITGYASPESSYTFNERLSGARAGAVKNYIRRLSGLPEQLFSVYPGGEDWRKLRELVEESYLPYKDQVLAIIDNGHSYDHKEQQLKNLGSSYQSLLNDYFPLLRRVEYQIRYTVREYSKGEYQSVLKNDPGRLSPYELYQLSENYEADSEEWREILLLSARLYPADELSQINAAAIHLMKKEFDGAKVYLDRITASAHPEAWNNRAVYELHKGDYDKAEELFHRAAEKGLEEAKDNLKRLFEE